MYKGEWFSSISHLIGTVLALFGLVILVVRAIRQGDPWKAGSLSHYFTVLFYVH